MSRLHPLVQSGGSLLDNGDNMNGSALVGRLVPSTKRHATRVDRTRGDNVRAAAFDRVLRLPRKNCLVSAPNVGNFKAFSVRGRRLADCFGRVFGFSRGYGFSSYARARRPNYTIVGTIRRRCVTTDHCRDCLSVLRSGSRGGCHRTF